MKVVEKQLKELRMYENNPRNNDQAVEEVAKSIKEFGFKVPMVIDANNVIVCGHTRYKACLELGIETVPCVVADDLTPDQIRAFRLVENKTNELATWDFEKLDEEINLIQMDMGEFDFDVPDFSESVIEDDYDVDQEVEPRAKLGDLYQLGDHRLICGDSTDVSVIDRLMDGAKADMLLTDPPYNVDYTGKTKDALKIQNDKMDNDSFRQFLRDAFASADSNMRAGAVFYIWHADLEGYNFRGACADNNWKVRECLIWNKNSMVLGRQDYQWKHEPCLYGWKDGASHLWASDRKQTTVLNFDRPIRADLHPTMKPISLFAYQIGNNTHQGDAVLDLFGGSGSTLIACEQLKRKCYMCELDPHYVDVIISRWEKLTGLEAILING